MWKNILVLNHYHWNLISRTEQKLRKKWNLEWKNSFFWKVNICRKVLIFFFSHFTSVTDFVILNLYEADKLEKLDTFVKKHSLLRNFPKITIMQTKCRASVSPYYNNNIWVLEAVHSPFPMTSGKKETKWLVELPRFSN